jgi:hypothetical protein
VFILKTIFFSRTSKPISIKLVTNHPWVKGYLNYSNKGPDPLQRAENPIILWKEFMRIFQKMAGESLNF